MQTNFKYQLFGSKSSMDYDILVFIDKLSTIENNKKQVKHYEQILLKTFKNKPLNINLAIIKHNTIIDCFKGSPDELNNACFNTYKFHTQTHSNLIKYKVSRNVNLKIARTIRVLLSFLSKSDYRSIIKLTLKSNDIKTRFNTLQNIKLINMVNFGKNINTFDILKTIAFQLGQTIALIDGIELYSKEDIGNRYIDLKPFLNRQLSIDNMPLQKYLNLFLNKIKNNLHNIPNEILKK